MRVLAWIETGPEGHDLSCLRLDEIGIGHESQMLVALSQVPLVADLEEVLAVPQFYWGPDGFGLLSRMPRATHKGIQALQAASAEQGSSHGLSWRTVGPGDDLATLRWFDLDARSLYLAAVILSGRLVAADEAERELARAWRRHGRRRRGRGPAPGPGAGACRDGAPNRCRRPDGGHGAGRGDALDDQSPAATSASHSRTPIARAPPHRPSRSYPGPQSRMSLPHQTPARKPLRALLYAPFVAVLLLALAWSAGWFWLRGDVLRRMDTARTAWRAAGHDLGWTARTLSGFPFRLDLDLSDARMGDGSGWAISTPRLNAEAFVFSPSHWVLVAPGAVTITRRSAGPVIVHAKVLRASLSDFAARPLRLSVEGLALTFDAPPGEKPFLLASAAEFHLHTRAGPDDQGALYLGLENAAPAHGGALERVAAGQSVNLTLDGLYDHAAAMRGRDWPDSLQAWKAAGGAFNLRLLKIEAGPPWKRVRATRARARTGAYEDRSWRR